MKTNMFSKLKGVVVFFKIKLASCYHELYQNALSSFPPNGNRIGLNIQRQRGRMVRASDF